VDCGRNSRPAARNGGLGSAIVVLYLAISLGFQRIIVQQRARRLQPGGPPAFGQVERPS
jgi:hypothetical protein